MARLVATREGVFAAADRLTKEGKDPSTIMVRSICGGSNSTVQELLKEWQAERSRQTEQLTAMPEAIAQQGERFLLEIWNVASRIANADTKAIKEQAEKQVHLANRQLAEALQEIDRLQTQVDMQAEQIDSQSKTIRDHELTIARLESAEQRTAAMETELVHLREKLVTLEQEKAGLKAKAELGIDLKAIIAELELQRSKGDGEDI